ncbi:hypothetical protein ACQ858_01830 [Variovorax ureilyticus]|uniref:hypothetical protein n=1 Tax=Variovorax ureilyticus TaxID=1836198 RepID=UPI003D673AB5
MTRPYGWSLLGLAAVLQGCCVMPPPPPPPPPPPHHHEHRPPPPEFMRACEGQHEGAAVQLTGRDGEPLEGTCRRAPDGRLVFMPPPTPQR